MLSNKATKFKIFENLIELNHCMEIGTYFDPNSSWLAPFQNFE
jgi:hypothetical protein